MDDGHPGRAQGDAPGHAPGPGGRAGDGRGDHLPADPGEEQRGQRQPPGPGPGEPRGGQRGGRARRRLARHGPGDAGQRHRPGGPGPEPQHRRRELERGERRRHRHHEQGEGEQQARRARPGRGPWAAVSRQVAANQAMAACPAVKATAKTPSTARAAQPPSRAPTVPARVAGVRRVRTSSASRRLTVAPSTRWADQTSRAPSPVSEATTEGMTSMPAPRTPAATCPASSRRGWVAGVPRADGFARRLHQRRRFRRPSAMTLARSDSRLNEPASPMPWLDSQRPLRKSVGVSGSTVSTS